MYTHSMTHSFDGFDHIDYALLHSIVFSTSTPYPGYTPQVLEIPNGDGRVDREKRYAHVDEKALAKLDPERFSTVCLWDALNDAHGLALRVAEALGVPEAFMPVRSEGALRILEYPPGVGGHAHTDFDLFTLSLYRSEPERLRLAPLPTTRNTTCAAQLAHQGFAHIINARRLNPGMHIGELGELVGLGDATRHHVEPSTETQYSIVYFALPSPDAVLPGYQCAKHLDKSVRANFETTVGDWLAERYARSRVPA